MPKLSRAQEFRVMLASMGVLSMAVAWLLNVLAPAPWERCLQLVDPAPHCWACWAAMFFFAAAALPWPRRLVALVRG